MTKSIFLPRKQKLFTMSDIAIRVKKIIVDKLGVDEAEVTNEASFTNDLGADSLDTVELIMEFEKEFNISIPDESQRCRLCARGVLREFVVLLEACSLGSPHLVLY